MQEPISQYLYGSCAFSLFLHVHMKETILWILDCKVVRTQKITVAVAVAELPPIAIQYDDNALQGLCIGLRFT